MSAGTPTRAKRTEEGAWHVLPAHEVARRLETDAARGLALAEVARRLGQYGPNTLAETKGRSALAILVDQFRSLIVALLIAATAVALALGETIEAVAILIVLVLNAAIGFLTEWKAEQALTALRKQTSAVAHVSGMGKRTRSPRPTWYRATWPSWPPGPGCPPTGGSSRACGSRWKRRR
jgi:Ca2+-transporting ATPase